MDNDKSILEKITDTVKDIANIAADAANEALKAEEPPLKADDKSAVNRSCPRPQEKTHGTTADGEEGEQEDRSEKSCRQIGREDREKIRSHAIKERRQNDRTENQKENGEENAQAKSPKGLKPASRETCTDPSGFSCPSEGRFALEA